MRKLIAIKLVDMLDIKRNEEGSFDPIDGIGTVLKDMPIKTVVYRRKGSIAIDWDYLINWEDFKINHEGK